MNLPVLPTDNFYKFMALSGLAIVIFCIVVPMQRISEINLKTVEINTQIAILEIDNENVKNDILDALSTKGIFSTKKQALMRKALEDLFKRKDIKELSKKWKGEPVLNIKEQAILRKENNEIRKKIAKIKGEREKVIMLKGELKRYIWMVRLMDLVGSILFVYGLYLWYVKTQRPNDILLQRQIKGKG